MKLRAFFILLFVGVAAPLGADAPADLPAKVKQLVEQLNDPARQLTAQTELLKLGIDILPHLPGPDAKLSPIQLERLKSIQGTLLEAKLKKDLAPGMVTLQAPALSLDEALKQLRKQTGVEVVDRRQKNNEDVRLKLNLPKATFWQALDAVAAEADAQVSLFQKDGTLALVDGPHRKMPASYSGLFRVVVKRIAAIRDLELDDHDVVVFLEIAWEPRFQPLFLQNRPESLIVKDDKGVDVKTQETGSGRVPLSGGLATEVKVHLEAPRRSVHRLGLFKGSFSIIGPGKMLEFQFDQLATVDRGTSKNRGPAQTKEGITVRMREFKVEPELWTVSLALEYPPDGPDFESFESWLVHNEIALENKAGKRFPPAGYDVEEQGARRALVTYRFAEENDLVLGKPENWKLIYRLPGRIAEVPVHFEFKDLPLP